MGQFSFDPETYIELIAAEVPGYERLQDEVVAACEAGARRILELGTGRPSRTDEQMQWLADAGLSARVARADRDLAVLVADTANGS